MEIVMDIAHAKAINIADILSRLHVEPAKTNGHKLLYLSPVRNEKTPSFWVDTQTNRWKDFGTGEGGDSIDLVCAYLKSTREDCTTADALRWLSNMEGGFHPAPILRQHTNWRDVEKPDPSLTIKTVKPVQHLALTHYLNKRGIPLTVARTHLKEIHLRNRHTGKGFFALGFANEEGGYELRNPFFKGCIGSKAISFIRGSQSNPDTIHLFEGGMDYLSAIAQHHNKPLTGDAIILNSLAILNSAFPYIHNYGYRMLYSWLDNDATGEKAGPVLAEFCKTQADLSLTTMNKVYAPHKDVNAWHMHTRNLTL